MLPKRSLRRSLPLLFAALAWSSLGRAQEPPAPTAPTTEPAQAPPTDTTQSAPSAPAPTEQPPPAEPAAPAVEPNEPVRGPKAATSPVPEAAPRAESHGFFRKYMAYIDRKVDDISDRDLWGSTATLPQGYVKLRYEINPVKAIGRYDRYGNRVRLLPPIQLGDTSNPGQVLTIDPIVQGRGTGHTFSLGVGITDRWEAVLEFPFVEINSSLDLQVSRGGVPLSTVDRALFDANIEAQGRPLPNSAYDGKLTLQNVALVQSINFYRTRHVSTAFVPRVYFPTGVIANPNNDLTFLRGPEVDRGMPTWGLAVGQQFDLRPLEWLMFSAELTGSYYFRYRRKSPKWNQIADCRRLSDPVRRGEVGCSAGTPYDRAYDLEQSTDFPDMSGLDDTYEYQPGLGATAAFGVTLRPIPIPVSAVYSVSHYESPLIRATGANGAGDAFERTAQTFQLLLASTLHQLALSTTIPLFPIYIPGTLTLGAKFALAGENAIVLGNNFSVAFELYLPVIDAISPVKEKEPKAATAKRASFP